MRFATIFAVLALLAVNFSAYSQAQNKRQKDVGSTETESGAAVKKPCDVAVAEHRLRKLKEVLPDWKANQQDLRDYEFNSSIKCIASHLKLVAEKLNEKVTKKGDPPASVYVHIERIAELQAQTSIVLSRIEQRLKSGQGDAALIEDLMRLISKHIQALEDSVPRGIKTSPNDTAADDTKNPAAAAAEHPDEKWVKGQINPTDLLATYFDTQRYRAEFAMVMVPDPRIPRHRRAYDNSIVSVIQGMLRNGYVLDRYGFPWQQEIGSRSDVERLTIATVAEDGRYGLMIFRNDRWRSGTAESESSLRALYVIPEAVTYGVQTKAFQAALRQIRTELNAQRKSRTRQARASVVPPKSCSSNQAIRVFGPAFSGSMDSILRAVSYEGLPSGESSVEKVVVQAGAAAASGLGNELLCVFASAATSATNEAIKNASGAIKYGSGAVNDVIKLQTLANLLKGQLNVAANQVAFFSEASVFGAYLCSATQTPRGVREFCNAATWVNFPVNIADIRHGVREKRRKAREAVNTAVASSRDSLTLEDGAENGSELPESQQSPLTAVSNQLDLSAAIGELGKSKPRAVVIVATDVRDRLFLFEQVRKRLPNVLLIDFETDRLLAHPDYINSSRGVLTLASSNLQWNEQDPSGRSGGEERLTLRRNLVYAAPTDNQAILTRAVQRWNPAQSWSANDDIRLHVVTREGLVPADMKEGDASTKVGRVLRWGKRSDVFAFTSLVLVVCAVWSLASWRRRNASAWFPVGKCVHAVYMVIAIVVTVILSGWLGKKALYALQISIGAWAVYQYLHTANPVQAVERSTVPDGLMRWLPRLFMLALLTLILVSELLRAEGAMGLEEFRSTLETSWRGGLSYTQAVKVALIVILLAFWFTHAYTHITVTHGSGSTRVFNDDRCTRSVQEMYAREQSFWTAPGLLVLSVAVALLFYGKPEYLRLTLWGPFADRIAYFALIAVTLISALLFAASVRVVQRILAWCHAAEYVLGEEIGKKLLLPRLASTPVGARAFHCSCHYKEHKDPGIPNPCLRLSDVLCAEMTLYRWAAIGGGVSAVAAAWMVYLFPITNADWLLLLNLIVLVLAGLYFAYNTVRFERNAVLSRLLCNRDQETEFSVVLFSYVALPFVVMAAVILLFHVPGVLDWGAGFISLANRTRELLM